MTSAFTCRGRFVSGPIPQSLLRASGWPSEALLGWVREQEEGVRKDISWRGDIANRKGDLNLDCFLLTRGVVRDDILVQYLDELRDDLVAL